MNGNITNEKNDWQGKPNIVPLFQSEAITKEKQNKTNDVLNLFWTKFCVSTSMDNDNDNDMANILNNVINDMIHCMMYYHQYSDNSNYIWASSRENLSLRFPTRSDTNLSAYPQQLARGLKFRLKNLEILYYLSSEQRRWSDCVRLRGYAVLSAPLLFAYGKNRFPQDEAHIKT